MKATEQYFPMVLFIMLYKVFLTFDSVDEIPPCYHSNESYRAVLSCSGAAYYAVQRWFGVINLWTKSLREAVQVKHKAMYATQHFSCTVCPLHQVVQTSKQKQCISGLKIVSFVQLKTAQITLLLD